MFGFEDIEQRIKQRRDEQQVHQKLADDNFELV